MQRPRNREFITRMANFVRNELNLRQVWVTAGVICTVYLLSGNSTEFQETLLLLCSSKETGWNGEWSPPLQSSLEYLFTGQANPLPQHLSTTESLRQTGISVLIKTELGLFLAWLWKGAGVTFVQQIPSWADKGSSVLNIEPSRGKFCWN